MNDVFSRVCPAYVARMSAANQAMGIRGELVAAKWLTVHGWEIAERRFFPERIRRRALVESDVGA